MEIPLTDVKGLYVQLKDEIDEAIREVFLGGRYILGPNVTMLEQEIAEYCQTSLCIGVADGVDRRQADAQQRRRRNQQRNPRLQKPPAQ